MDKDLDNIVLETAMERYLKQKLYSQMQLNEDLAKLVRNEIEISPEDVIKFKEMEALVTILVKEALDDGARRNVIYNLGQLIRK